MQDVVCGCLFNALGEPYMRQQLIAATVPRELLEIESGRCGLCAADRAPLSMDDFLLPDLAVDLVFDLAEGARHEGDAHLFAPDDDRLRPDDVAQFQKGRIVC